jgi:hypothetical protein
MTSCSSSASNQLHVVVVLLSQLFYPIDQFYM